MRNDFFVTTVEYLAPVYEMCLLVKGQAIRFESDKKSHQDYDQGEHSNTHPNSRHPL